MNYYFECTHEIFSCELFYCKAVDIEKKLFLLVIQYLFKN